MTEWISVKDRLPNIGEKIPFIFAGDKVLDNSLGHIWYSSIENSWVKDGIWSDWDVLEDKITHWMPYVMPDPPKFDVK